MDLAATYLRIGAMWHTTKHQRKPGQDVLKAALGYRSAIKIFGFITSLT